MGTNKRRDRDRCDHVLTVQGLAQSRDAAVRMILAGKVKSNGAIVDKPSRVIPTDAVIEIIGESKPFVSRGGEKLAAALDAYSIAPRGMVCFDVGCSTGGFTDCLLQRGVARVYAVDVGYGQFDWRLRQDPRVVLIERTNIRYMAPSAIPEPVDLVVVPATNIFDAVAQTALQLDSAEIVAGLSNKMTAQEQSRSLGRSWEALGSRPRREDRAGHLDRVGDAIHPQGVDRRGEKEIVGEC